MELKYIVEVIRNVIYRVANANGDYHDYLSLSVASVWYLEE